MTGPAVCLLRVERQGEEGRRVRGPWKEYHGGGLGMVQSDLPLWLTKKGKRERTNRRKTPSGAKIAAGIAAGIIRSWQVGREATSVP